MSATHAASPGDAGRPAWLVSFLTIPRKVRQLDANKSGRATIIVACFLVVSTLGIRAVIRHDPNFPASTPTSKESMLVSLVVVAGAVTVWWTRFYERWMVWAAKPSSSGENGE